MILVVGASGKLGGRVTRRLLDGGEQVRVLSRDPVSRLGWLADTRAELVQGDVRDRPSLERALAGADIVVSCIHGLLPLDRRNTMRIVDRDGIRDLVDAAASAGVQHFVLTSIPGASVASSCIFAQMKGAAEESLRSSGLAFTIVKPWVFMETHVLDMFGAPLRTNGKVQFFGHGRTPLNYVSVDDVAEAVCTVVLDGPGEVGRSFVVGGPEVYTRQQTVDLLEAALGRRAKRTCMSPGTMRLLKFAARPFNPSLSYLLDFALTEETQPEAFAWTARQGDVIGQTRLETVIERWARSLPHA